MLLPLAVVATGAISDPVAAVLPLAAFVCATIGGAAVWLSRFLVALPDLFAASGEMAAAGFRAGS